MNPVATETSKLSEEEIRRIRRLLAGQRPFDLYFESSLADLRVGLDNRRFTMIDQGGLIMEIDFDDLRIISTVGEIAPEALESTLSFPGRLEYHIPDSIATRLCDRERNRFVRRDGLRYYTLDRAMKFSDVKGDLRRLTTRDLELVSAFYSVHYRETIFSSWMLERPFVGLFRGDTLLAAGGTIVFDTSLAAANVGNFLTAPEWRGHGLGKTVAKALINELIAIGMKSFTLGTVDSNVAARKTYEAIGFRLLSKRTELEFAALKGS